MDQDSQQEQLYQQSLLKFLKDTIELGNLNVSRDFNFATDIAEGYQKSILNNKTIGQTINLGSGLEIKIVELIDMIKKSVKGSLN